MKLMATNQPSTEWSSPIEAFEEIFKYEGKIMGLIKELFSIVLEEKDYATYSMLQQCEAEQVEEVLSYETVDKLKIAINDKISLLTLDSEIVKSQFVDKKRRGMM